MTRFLKPRSVYYAGLGLLAVTTVDLWRRVRKQSPAAGETVVLDVQDVPADTPPVARAKSPARPKQAAKPKAAPQTKAPSPSKSVPQSDSQPTPQTDPISQTAARVASGDDLTRLTGIGPTYAKRLKDAGLTTYQDIANASADQLSEITRATGSAADPEAWIKEARSLANS